VKAGCRSARRLGPLIGVLAVLLGWGPAASAQAATTYLVDKTSDSFGGGCTAAPNDCSVRDAIANANSGPGNTVLIPAGNYVLSLTGTGEDADATGDLDVITSMTIVGAGAGATTVSGNGIDRVFDFQNNPSGVWSLSGLTVTGGLVTLEGGAGIKQAAGTLSIASAVVTGNRLPSSNYGGGGIRVVTGTTNIDRSAITGNFMGTGEGGGIYTGAPVVLNLSNSELSGNSAVGNDGGGGIYNQDRLNMVNTTLSGNSTDDTGGGLDNHGPALIVNSTLAGNGAGVSGGGINRDSGALSLENTIVAGNAAPAGANCSGATISLGHNLDSGASCAFGAAGDLSNVDPLLGPLADNGGPTMTRGLRVGSPAVDAAAASACPGTDQRGAGRPQRAGCDIGAFELGPAPALSALAVQPSRFSAASGGGAVIARAHKHKRKRRKRAGGATVTYSLSDTATVAFSVERRITGRRAGGKCKPKRKKGKRCSVVVTMPGGFTVSGKAGPNSFKFSGRLNNRKLPPGSYQLVATPTDPAGILGTGNTVRAAFTIVR
jgi:hypothetical protein